jgi:sugar O-acyltransferase (sialic acid O-acetyltransferase NeuD family)|tara:strand:+ start:1607 stop:2272 length:666 start_codon:yes stop_codon:yes gene_type:complete
MSQKKLLIFGLGQAAELALFYFNSDSEYSVEAFSVDEAYMNTHEFCGLPVIAFEDVENKFLPSEYEMFIALGYSEVNIIRKNKYIAAKQKGYNLASYVSSKATIFDTITIGDNCFILENNTIQPFASIGSNVTLWSGNHIGHHSEIGDHVFIASHVVISGGVRVGSQSFLGVNATLRDNISIGEGCVIGAGALVNADVESHHVVKGTPSNIIFSTNVLKKI